MPLLELYPRNSSLLYLADKSYSGYTALPIKQPLSVILRCTRPRKVIGLKARSGVDALTGLALRVTITPVGEYDRDQAENLCTVMKILSSPMPVIRAQNDAQS